MPTLSPDAIAWKCPGCTAARAKPEKRLPKAWKRLADQIFCEACWQKRYMLRAIAIPVGSPLDQDWQTFRKNLREMWQLTTQASNWMMTQCYSHDVRRT